MRKNILRFSIIALFLTMFTMNPIYANTSAGSDTYEANARYIGSYNVVAFDSVVADQSAVEGAVAVKNSLDAPRNVNQNYTIGTAYSGSKFQHIGNPFDEKSQPALLLEKNQTSKGLFVMQGDTVMSTDSTYQNVNSAYNVYKKDPSEISSIFTRWQNETNSFINTVKRTEVGTVIGGGSTNSSMGKFTFNNSSNVNNVAVSVLPNTNGVSSVNEFNIPTEVNAKDYIVFYSDATTINFGNSWGAAMYNNQIINFNELYNGQNPIVKQLAQKIVFVFPNATSVNINNFAVPGTVVSPNAHIKGEGGSINGQAITKSLEQTKGFDIRNFRFSYLDAEANKFDFNDVTTGEINANDFSICFCDLQTVTDQQLITMAKVNATDSDGNLVKITSVNRGQLAGQTVDGVYPVTFNAEDGQTVTINVTLYHKNYTVNANDVTMTVKEFYRSTRNEIINRANITVDSPTGIVDKNNYTTKIETKLKFGTIPAVGSYQVKIIVDNCFEKTITVNITNDAVSPNEPRINNFDICFCDVPLLSDEEYIKLANVREFNNITGVYEKVTDIVSIDKSNLENATEPGIYQVLYKTSGNRIYSADANLYSKDYSLSAENVIYDKKLFNENSVAEILQKSNYTIYDPHNEKYLLLSEVKFNYTTTLVSTKQMVVAGVTYNVEEYDVNTSVDTCYKQDFKVYLTEKIDIVVPPEPPTPVTPVTPTTNPETSGTTNNLPQTGSSNFDFVLSFGTVVVLSLVTRKIIKK